MRSIESEGETIDQAIESALRALQVQRDRVEIDILADATRGLFGFGGKRARVRATVRASLWMAATEEVAAGSEEVPQGTIADPETRGTGDGRPGSSAPRITPGHRPSTPAPARPLSVDASPPSPEFQARCQDVLGAILSRIGVSCTVEARADDSGAIVLDVGGDSSGLLIGRRGQTLDALEYILNRIVGREDDGRAGRVVIDVERYRDRRKEYLDSLAHRLAEKTRQTGRVVTLNPMSPRDRRIVHLALQDDPNVATRSEGDGYYRKVLILPAERPRRGARSSRSAD